MARRLLIGAAIAALTLAVAGCSAGDPRACTVTCAADGQCPDGTTCGADLYCYGPSETPGSCSQTGDDLSDDDGADVSDDVTDVGDDGTDAGDDGTDDAGDDGADDGGDAACEPCDPVEQCGCIEGEACYIGGDAPEPSCAGAGEAGGEGACTDDADCAPGFGCAIQGQRGRHCQRYCNVDADCGGGLRLCNRAAGSATDIQLCTSNCDPVDTSACAFDEKCTLSQGAGGRWDARCLEHDGVVFGAECIDQFDCEPGLLCVDFAGIGSCEVLCTIGGTECGAGFCEGFFPPVEFVGLEYGFCN